MKTKQTAVDWLEEQISLLHALTTIEISLFEQANQMHKEQIKESFVNAYLIAEDGLSYDFAKIIAEQYYNETYNVKDNWQLAVKCKICLMLLLVKSDKLCHKVNL